MASQVIGLNAQGLRVGQYHQRAKITDAQVLRLHDLRAQGWGYARLAAEFGISKRHVRNICSGKSRCQSVAQFRIVQA